MKYVELRTKLISDILNTTKNAWPGDKQILSNVINLTTELECAEPDLKFINGLQGYLIYSSMANRKATSVLATVVHDLVEWSNNRGESWFSPRTSRYDRYLSGASGEVI
jgi:hypothetical protein